MRKASLGSVDFITSFCKSENESRKIKEAVRASSYGSEFVHAALSVDQKVRNFHDPSKFAAEFGGIISKTLIKFA